MALKLNLIIESLNVCAQAPVASTGLVEENLAVPITSLAAEFCTRCNLTICFLGRPCSNPLQ